MSSSERNNNLGLHEELPQKIFRAAWEASLTASEITDISSCPTELEDEFTPFSTLKTCIKAFLFILTNKILATSILSSHVYLWDRLLLHTEVGYRGLQDSNDFRKGFHEQCKMFISKSLMVLVLLLWVLLPQIQKAKFENQLYNEEKNPQHLNCTTCLDRKNWYSS